MRRFAGKIFAIATVFCASCIFTGCKVSNHDFSVHTGNGAAKPKMDIVCRDLHTFALAQGFTPQRYSSTFQQVGETPPGQKPLALPKDVENGRLPKEGGVAEYVKQIGRRDNSLDVIIGYYPRRQRIYVQVFGDNRSSLQRAADEFYAEFKRQFTAKYGLDAISDHRDP